MDEDKLKDLKRIFKRILEQTTLIQQQIGEMEKLLFGPIPDEWEKSVQFVNQLLSKPLDDPPNPKKRKRKISEPMMRVIRSTYMME
jgi:hypothetical protein